MVGRDHRARRMVGRARRARRNEREDNSRVATSSKATVAEERVDRVEVSGRINRIHRIENCLQSNDCELQGVRRSATDRG